MTFAHEEIGHIISFDSDSVAELVIENHKLFFALVEDFFNQSDGLAGKIVISHNNKPLEISRHCEILTQFAPFDMNKKTLLSKIHSALEKDAINEENYMKTMEFLKDLEMFLDNLSKDFPCPLTFQKLSVSSLIKAASPEVDDVTKPPLEKILDYMDLVREFDRDKLFVTVNLRTFFDDSEMGIFTESVCFKGIKLLMLENFSQKPLNHARHYTVDDDLCEF